MRVGDGDRQATVFVSHIVLRPVSRRLRWTLFTLPNAVTEYLHRVEDGTRARTNR